MKILNLIFRRGCTHRFSWPRIDPRGRHYQICLDCGAAYAYDWDLMKRTVRVGREAAASAQA